MIIDLFCSNLLPEPAAPAVEVDAVDEVVAVAAVLEVGVGGWAGMWSPLTG